MALFLLKYKGWSGLDIMRDLGVGAQYRYISVIKEKYQDMEVIERNEPPYLAIEFRTPLGSVRRKDAFTPDTGEWESYSVEKLFKSEEDYPIIKYVLEHTTPVEDTGYHEVRNEVDEDGMVMTGAGENSPAQRIMLEIMGYDVFFYELMGHPTKLEELSEKSI